jgi:hypothetical protein
MYCKTRGGGPLAMPAIVKPARQPCLVESILSMSTTALDPISTHFKQPHFQILHLHDPSGEIFFGRFIAADLRYLPFAAANAVKNSVVSATSCDGRRRAASSAILRARACGGHKPALRLRDCETLETSQGSGHHVPQRVH